ncbi:hypothetical protein [Novosphingobium taihuense]|uniref:Lipoprotein n=1 Tax=Novosphingobium taihuense TaxID=260085 RepID=A0A7W7ETE7_9SPHN|nr:hypothetical protein [Novosphingobium taihuense]MBB4612796.1 hypothetical protein [Novosphingobium taihuense]TWH80293.1 hypothetical protein IQ25_03753 [Novosphingobium taihuense]
MKVLTALSLACVLALGGCAADGQQAARGTPAPLLLTSTAEPAEAVAGLLADADSAQGDPKRLGMILAALDAFGARPMAGEADPVVAWRSRAEMPKAPPYRGRVLGPAYKAGMLNPGATVRLPQLFDGGRSARVAVATPGQAGLDFTVLDGEAKPVCPPAKARTRECMWTPLFSGRFEIVLTNPSSNAAGYYLVID